MYKLINYISSVFFAVLVLLSCVPEEPVMEYTGNRFVVPIYDENFTLSGQIEVKELTKKNQIELNVVTSVTFNGDLRISLNNNNFINGGSEIVLIGSIGAGKEDKVFLVDPSVIVFYELGGISGHFRFVDNDGIFGGADIGKESFNPVSKLYQLTNYVTPFASQCEYFQRNDGSAVIKINIGQTTVGASHPAYIYNGSIDLPGNVLFTLNPLSGDLGIGLTNLKTDDNGNNKTYEDLINTASHIKIVESAIKQDVIIADGNLGPNFTP